MGEFQQALAAELTLWGQGLGRPAVGTVFFGGGTPSYLPEGAIGDILSAARNAFNVDPGAEDNNRSQPWGPGHPRLRIPASPGSEPFEHRRPKPE